MRKLKRLRDTGTTSEISKQESSKSLKELNPFKPMQEENSLTENSSASTSQSNPSLDFQKALDESKANILNDDKKKRRGRQPYPRDASGNIIRPEKKEIAPMEQTQNYPPPDKPIIKATLKMPFDAIAHRTGVNEIALSEIEADALTEQAVPLVQAWFPAMQTKETALMIFGFNLGCIAFSKYLIYKAAIEEAKRKREELLSQPSNV